MAISKYVNFDLLINRARAQNKKQLIKNITNKAAPIAGAREELLFDACYKHLNEKGCSYENGLAIFDMRSTLVKKPVIFISTLDMEVDFGQQGNQPSEIFVGLLSTASCGPLHLQRLSSIARLFRSKSLCDALREASSVDEMSALFMPTQDWMVAA